MFQADLIKGFQWNIQKCSISMNYQSQACDHNMVMWQMHGREWIDT